MTSDLLNAELFDSYLSKEMSPEDRRKFDRKLQEDQEFSEIVSLYKEVDMAIAETDVMELRQSLQSVHEMVSEEWAEEAPMLTDSFDKEITTAIEEEDVMQLRSMLNDIHDLQKDELYNEQSIDIPDLDHAISEMIEEEDSFYDDEISKALLDVEVMELRGKLESIGKDVDLTRPRRQWYQKVSKLTAVASVLLLLLIGGTFWFGLDSKSINPDRAVEKYFSPVKKTVLRGANDESRWMAKAYENYRQADYLIALDYFDFLRVENPGLYSANKDIEMAMYVGNSYFFSGNLEKAIDEFEIVSAGDNTWINDAQWYLAGCYLKTEDMDDRAVELLNELAMRPDNKYAVDSRKLLKDLKRE